MTRHLLAKPSKPKSRQQPSKSPSQAPKKKSNPSATSQKPELKRKIRRVDSRIIYRKTPMKSDVSAPVLHSKRRIKKTERAVESAEQAKLFQTFKSFGVPPKAQKPEAQKSRSNGKKRVSFNLKTQFIDKPKPLGKKASIHKERPLQGIMKSNNVESRVLDLEKKVAEIFKILKILKVN